MFGIVGTKNCRIIQYNAVCVMFYFLDSVLVVNMMQFDVQCVVQGGVILGVDIDLFLD